MIEANKLKKIEDCKGKLKQIVGDEGVLQLAKDGSCPHYIIINPITKEESIWFIPSELNEWFDENFIHYKEGNFVQNYKFTYFDKEVHRATKKVPDELLNIKNLLELPIENISTPSGIYFLCKENKIKYIGQSNYITGRVTQHIAEGIKDFSNVFFISCPLNKLNELETLLIRHFQPELNKKSIGKFNTSCEDNKVFELLNDL